MKPKFYRVWVSFDLGDYRPCSGTYQNYEYDDLPPITETLDGTFSFLGKSPAPQKAAAKKAAPVKKTAQRMPAKKR